MSSSDLPPDPYLALGVAKDATSAAIKATYRKLVLKCHPDKIKDEAKKQEASDRFHQIQSAYEIVGDDDRRARYDAQCKLVELRKDVMERGGGGASPRGGADVRTAAYKMPTESNRGGDFYTKGPERFSRASPLYEERRPSYAQEEYFDLPPRSSRGKYDDYERPSSKRSPPKEDRKAKASSKEAKENERSSRKEKSRRTEKDVRRERDRKSAFVTVETTSEDDSDPYERQRRKAREEDELQRAKEQFYEQARTQKEEAESGAYADDRARKIFTQDSGAREYIERSTRNTRARPGSERRPSPVRQQSSKDKVEYIKRNDKPPVMIRRGSGRPRTTGRETSKSSPREKERKSSVEVDESPRRMDSTRRPPTLNHTKSSPPDLRPEGPSPFDRQRSRSMEDTEYNEPAPIPQMRRSETMPTAPTTSTMPRDARGRKEGSKLRPESVYATPEPTPEPEGRKPYRYGHEYADDMEYPTPDGYKTEVVEPRREKRYTRSPSPIKEREPPQRAASVRHASAPQPPPLSRTMSTHYVYPGTVREDPYSRPAPSRENSRLYGEIPTTSRSPRPPYTYSPPPDGVRVQKEVRPEDIKFQTGYSRRSSHMNERPSYSRQSSRRTVKA